MGNKNRALTSLLRRGGCALTVTWTGQGLQSALVASLQGKRPSRLMTVLGAPYVPDPRSPPDEKPRLARSPQETLMFAAIWQVLRALLQFIMPPSEGVKPIHFLIL